MPPLPITTDRLLQLLPRGMQLPAFRALFSMEMLCISAKCFQICFVAHPIRRGIILPGSADTCSGFLSTVGGAATVLVFAARKVRDFPTCTQISQTLLPPTQKRSICIRSCFETGNVAQGKSSKSLFTLFPSGFCSFGTKQSISFLQKIKMPVQGLTLRQL